MLPEKEHYLSIYPFQLDTEKICIFFIVEKCFDSVVRLKFIFLFIYVVR